MSKELAQIETQSPAHLIELALSRQATPETLTRLLDLQERWEAGQAKKAYVKDMTEFKKEAPAVLIKSDSVDFQTAKGRTSYKYANLGSIVQEITAMLSKHNFSASWETRQDGRSIGVTCHITHAQGHRESVSLNAPPDESGNKNPIQSVGSTVTYLQRYTLLAALGLATGEDDNDSEGARAVSSKPSTKPPEKKEADITQGKDEKIEITGVAEITQRHGVNKKTKKPYTLYTIHGGGGKTYTSFDEKIANMAKSAKEAALQIRVRYMEGQYGNTIEDNGVEVIEPNIESKPVDETDEINGFNQPPF